MTHADCRSTSRSSPACPARAAPRPRDVLEDLGFFVIDNLPPTLIGKVAELARGTREAGALRARRRRALRRLPRTTSSPRSTSCARNGARTRVLFLDAADDVLVRRYEASRRRHPLSDDRPRLRRHRARARAARAAEGRGRPRRRHVDAQRARAARPPARAVRRRRRRRRRCRSTSCRSATSTGCRSTSTSCSTAASCPNPHWVDELRPLDRASTRRSATTCSRSAETGAFLDELDRLFALLLPAYEREGKAYLSIGVGCTGGRHRSVVDRRPSSASGSRRHGYRAARAPPGRRP